MVQSIDEVEDLTRFADESFDTDTVDLFEFTGNEDSPLTRLKSIILSLDWEITDDILDELVEEVSNLRSMWEGDKVAQVYLQGMDKVGRYLKVEGAYAHNNAIKLLLTLFYNYEKIISSPDISGDTITTLLKSDIRKFKVLQYQIGIKGGSPNAIESQLGATGESSEQVATDEEQLTALEAVILSLDWEVTDEALMQFHNQASLLNDQLADNSHARILVQGLQAIGGYISDEKANAHPDAFTLLHSFYDGLKSLVKDHDLESDRRQEIVIDQVSRLNTLKEIIAGTVPAPTVERTGSEIDKILDLDDTEPEQESDVDEIIFSDNEALDDTAPAGDLTESADELDIAFTADQLENEQGYEDTSVMGASQSEDDEFDLDVDIEETVNSVNAAMETADEQYPDEVLDPAAIKPLSNEIADEFIEEELNLSSKWRTEPHEIVKKGLSLEPDDTPLSKQELDDELELLFDEGLDAVPAGSTPDEIEFEKLALGLDTDDISNDDETGSTGLDIEESLTADNKEEVSDLDFGDELFLSVDEETLNQPEQVPESITPALADADEAGGFIEEDESTAIGDGPSAELEDKLDSFFGLSEDEETETAQDSDSVLDAAEDEAVSPALSDADEEEGFSEEAASAGLAEESSSELEDKLDTFFDLSDDTSDITSAETDSSSDHENVEAGDDETVVAALADETTDGGFSEDEVVAELNEDPTDQLQDKLDSFFGDDNDQPQTETATEDEFIPLDEDVDSFFTDEETTPALSGAEELSGFDEAEEVSGLADSAMDEIDDKLDSFFDLDTEESNDDSAVDLPALLSLQAAASALSSTPDSSQLQQQVSELVTTVKAENHGTNHTVLLTMIETAVELLSRNNKAAAETGSIVQELTAGLEEADNPSALIDMVCRYTEWQKEFFDRVVNTAPQTAPPVPQEEVIDQVQSGFSELRGTLMSEFDAIRKELKKE